MWRMTWLRRHYAVDDVAPQTLCGGSRGSAAPCHLRHLQVVVRRQARGLEGAHAERDEGLAVGRAHGRHRVVAAQVETESNV